MDRTSLELLLPRWEALEGAPPVYLIQSEASHIPRKHSGRLGIVRGRHLSMAALGRLPDGGFYETGYAGRADKNELHRLAELAGRCMDAGDFGRFVPASEPGVVSGADVCPMPFPRHPGAAEWWAVVFALARRAIIPHAPRGRITNWTGDDWSTWEPGLPITRIAVIDDPAEASRFAIAKLAAGETAQAKATTAPPRKTRRKTGTEKAKQRDKTKQRRATEDWLLDKWDPIAFYSYAKFVEWLKAKHGDKADGLTAERVEKAIKNSQRRQRYAKATKPTTK